MLTLVLFSIAMIILAKLVTPQLIGFNFKAYLSFLKIMLAVTAIRLVHFYLAGYGPNLQFVEDFSLAHLFLVFWEDMFFVFPCMLLYFFTKNKLLVAPLMIVSALSFSLGHIYQSWTWAIILLAYVPLMFYYGRKYGLSTVMAAHVTYDVTTYLTIYAWTHLL